MAVDLLAMEENLRWEGATNAEAKGWVSIAVEKGKVTHGTPQKRQFLAPFWRCLVSGTKRPRQMISRDAASSLFGGRNKRFHVTGLSFSSQGKTHVFQRKKRCFFTWTYKLPVFLWRYMLALGKKRQDLLHNGFWWPTDTVFAKKVSFWGQNKPFGKPLFQTRKLKAKSNTASFKTPKTNRFSASLVC